MSAKLRAIVVLAIFGLSPDGAAHAQGFKLALTRTVNAFARKAGLIKEKDPVPSGEDLREGNAKAQKARERMGEVPLEVLDGHRRARHAPERRPIVKPPAGTAGLMRSGGLLDLPSR